MAQVTAGSISGYVHDPGARVVAGAQVSIKSSDRGITRDVRTDASGFYSAADLPPSDYEVRVSSEGFEPASAPARVPVNTRVRLDLVLRLPTQRVDLEVAAAAPMVASESSELGAVLDQPRIELLPLNRRDFLQLALLVPGVLPPVQDSELSTRGRFAMHANGGREEFNNFLLDGVDNNDQYQNTYALQPSVDSIQEFKIATNSYSAEYGRSAAGQVNVITRSGVNQWHGAAYEYLRNRVLDARNFFDGPQKPKFVRNQFGGSVGGPVWKDRSFFFANFDGLRERRGLTRLATVPTLEQRSGDLSSLGRPIIDPFAQRPFAGGVIPAERISPVARRVLELFPRPDRPGVSGNYLAQPVQRDSVSQFHGRLDQRLSARDQLTLRYSRGTQDLFEPYTEESTDIPGFGDFVENSGHNAMVHYQRTISPRTIQSLRLGFNRTVRGVRPQNFATNVGELWGVPWLNVRPRDFGYPLVNVAGFSQVGDVAQLPIGRVTNTFQIVEGLALVRGGHTLRTGGEVRHVRLNGFLDYFARGSLTFSGVISGTGLSDLLLGFPSFGLQSQFDNPQHLRATSFNAYLQDDWKVRPSFTLSLGVRYEYDTPPVDAADRMAVFNPAALRIVNVGTNGISRSGLRPDKNNFAPRVGFAWSPATHTVLRGGYGLYYDAGMLVVNSSFYFNPPYFNFRIFFPTQTSLISLNNPFPSQGGITPAPSPNTLSPDFATAYMQHWSFNVQRQAGRATVLSLAYAGSKGTHLVRARDLNQPRPAPGPVQARRPLPQFGGIYFIDSGANSNFHSLQASVDRRLARRFSVLAAYTWSKSIDDTSGFLSTRADRNFPQDSMNVRAERAASSFDMTHRLTAAYVYLLPRGFEFRGITTAQSGQAFTPLLRFDNSNTGNTGGIFGNDRPDVLRDPRLDHPGPDRWFDTAAFRVPPPFQFGNAGRNILRGPGAVTFDVALAKRFLLTERLALTADAQVFNLFNRTQFDLPERYADEPATFGRVFSARSPRQMQFALRLSF